MMTCHCTCGKCDCPQIKINWLPGVAVAAAAGGPAVQVYHGNTGAWQPQFVDLVPNANCAGPTMPNFSVRIEP